MRKKWAGKRISQRERGEDSPQQEYDKRGIRGPEKCSLPQERNENREVEKERTYNIKLGRFRRDRQPSRWTVGQWSVKEWLKGRLEACCCSFTTSKDAPQQRDRGEPRVEAIWWSEEAGDIHNGSKWANRRIKKWSLKRIDSEKLRVKSWKWKVKSEKLKVKSWK